MKSEVNHESDARQSVFDRSCTPPASSPEGGRLLKKPASKRLPTTPQRSPLGAFRAPANNQGIRESFSRAEGYLTTTILPQMPTTERHSGHLSLTISNRQPYGLSAKTSKAQENCEEPGPHVTLDGKSTRTGYPTTLPPPKLRPSTSKITTPTPGPVRTVPTHPSTAEEPLLVREHTTKGRSCCRLMCSQCTPKDVWEEYGLGPPDKRLNIPRLKSMSAYPSSVSSLGPDDDIPLSNKMHREAGRAVAESTKTYASGGLSEISPSPRYSDLLARLGISRPSPTENENRSDVYDDFEGDSLPQKDPCRVIFGKAGKAITDLSRSQHSHNVEDYIGKGEKKLQQIPGRPLRSFSSANDLSKKSQNLDQEISQGDADNSSNEASNDPLGKEDRGEDVDSGSEYEERASRIASNRAPPGVKSSSQSIKRAREVIDEWQPTFSDDEDMADEDDIIEINQDVFELSESRRKKRHKSKLHDANRNLVLASLVLKEEQVTENEDISSVTQNARATKVIGKNSTGMRLYLIIDFGLLYDTLNKGSPQSSQPLTERR